MDICCAFVSSKEDQAISDHIPVPPWGDHGIYHVWLCHPCWAEGRISDSVFPCGGKRPEWCRFRQRDLQPVIGVGKVVEDVPDNLARYSAGERKAECLLA